MIVRKSSAPDVSFGVDQQSFDGDRSLQLGNGRYFASAHPVDNAGTAGVETALAYKYAVTGYTRCRIGPGLFTFYREIDTGFGSDEHRITIAERHTCWNSFLSADDLFAFYLFLQVISGDMVAVIQ